MDKGKGGGSGKEDKKFLNLNIFNFAVDLIEWNGVQEAAICLIRLEWAGSFWNSLKKVWLDWSGLDWIGLA